MRCVWTVETFEGALYRLLYVQLCTPEFSLSFSPDIPGLREEKIQEVQSAFLPPMSTWQHPNISVNNRTQDRCQDPNWKSVGRSPTNLSIHRHSYMSAILTRSSSSPLLALAGALYITGTHNSAIITLSLRSVQNHRCVKTNTFDHFNQYFRQEWSWMINCSHSDPKYIALDVIDLNKHKSRYCHWLHTHHSQHHHFHHHHHHHHHYHHPAVDLKYSCGDLVRVGGNALQSSGLYFPHSCTVLGFRILFLYLVHCLFIYTIQWVKMSGKTKNIYNS